MWKVTLFNHHAMCGIGGRGRTRREAFNRAFHRAGLEFRYNGYYRLTREGNDVMWLACFYDALAGMRRGASRHTFKDHQERTIEICRERVGAQ